MAEKSFLKGGTMAEHEGKWHIEEQETGGSILIAKNKKTSLIIPLCEDDATFIKKRFPTGENNKHSYLLPYKIIPGKRPLWILILSENRCKWTT